MTLVSSKSLLDDYEVRARVYYPSIDLHVRTLDGIQFVLWSGRSNRELTEPVSKSVMIHILKALCNCTRDELCARLETFQNNPRLERIFDEQMEARLRFEDAEKFK